MKIEIEKIIKDQNKIYLDNFLKNKDSSKGTFQNNRVTQHLRFQKVLEPFNNILNENISFLDVGCGCCDMYQYILDNNIKTNYAGVDIIDEMIDHSKHRFPGINVSNQNILSSKYNSKFDIIVFSGGLYLKGNIIEKEWSEFVYSMINKMYTLSKIGISFNLLTTYKNKHNDELFYLDPKEIIDYTANNLSRFFNLSHSYPLYEWTMSIFNPDYIKSIYSLPEYDKYLKK